MATARRARRLQPRKRRPAPAPEPARDELEDEELDTAERALRALIMKEDPDAYKVMLGLALNGEELRAAWDAYSAGQDLKDAVASAVNNWWKKHSPAERPRRHKLLSWLLGD